MFGFRQFCVFYIFQYEMMFQDSFEQLLRDYPDAVSDRRKLAGLLKDYFPDRQMQVNLINEVHTLGNQPDHRRRQHIIIVNNSFIFHRRCINDI